MLNRFIGFLRVLFTVLLLAGLMTSCKSTSDAPKVAEEPARSELIDKLQKGINFSAPFEYDLGDYEFRFGYEETYYRQTKAAGFDHIRLPAIPKSYFVYADDGTFTIDASYMEALDKGIRYAIDSGLTVILDISDHEGLRDDFDNVYPEFKAMWSILAEHYRDWEPELMFEIFNEPSGDMTLEQLNRMQNEIIALIRETNPERVIVAGCLSSNLPAKLSEIELPDAVDDPNIILDVHNYAPKSFTHQPVAGFTDEVTFADMDKKACEEQFAFIDSYREKTDRTIWMGEWGCYQSTIPHEDTASYVAFFTELCNEYNVPWCWWNFAWGFSAYDMDEGCFKEWVIRNMGLTPAAVN